MPAITATHANRESLAAIPVADRGAILALSVLCERIDALSTEDRQAVVESLAEWNKETDAEEKRQIFATIEEIVAQRPVTWHQMPVPPDASPMTPVLHDWAKTVGRRIREFREAAGWNQSQLAEKAGLTQSHISRLENAEHSATNFTLEKIAKALGVPIARLDPATE